MKLSNNLQPPLSPPSNFENNIYLCYKFMFELFDYYFMQWNFYVPADAVDDDLQKISGHLQGAE